MQVNVSYKVFVENVASQQDFQSGLHVFKASYILNMWLNNEIYPVLLRFKTSKRATFPKLYLSVWLTRNASDAMKASPLNCV